MSKLQQAVAHVYRRAGRERMEAAELRHVVSLDLRWFPPEDARRFVDRCLQQGLLREAEGGLEPTFDPADVQIPSTFQPTPSILEGEASGTLVEEVSKAIAGATGEDADLARKDVSREVARLGGLVTEEVAAILLAEREGLDVSGWIGPARETLRNRQGDRPATPS